MKSERRHELQHNELATWLIKVGQTIKPYQNMAFGVVALVLVALIGYNVWSRMEATETAKAWDEVNANIEGGDVVKLAKVVEDYPNTNAAHMAAVVLADYYLAAGCNGLFINKATAQQELRKAIELYQVVRDQSRLPSLLERATFGLARARESKGEADQIKMAEQLYEEVATKWPKGAFAAAAQQRREDLARPATKQLYDDFRKFDPKPAFSKETGVQPPFDMNSLPAEGSAEMPPTTFNLKIDDKDKKTDQVKEGKKKTTEKTDKK